MNNKKKANTKNESDFNSSLEKLREIREKIYNELISLDHVDNVYWQIQAIIRENPDINRDDTLPKLDYNNVC